LNIALTHHVNHFAFQRTSDIREFARKPFRAATKPLRAQTGQTGELRITYIDQSVAAPNKPVSSLLTIVKDRDLPPVFPETCRNPHETTKNLLLQRVQHSYQSYEQKYSNTS
jgi:hypothetical protein